MHCLESLEEQAHTVAQEFTEVRFASGGFTIMAVINPPERKLAKRTSVKFRQGKKLLCLLFGLDRDPICSQ